MTMSREELTIEINGIEINAVAIIDNTPPNIEGMDIRGLFVEDDGGSFHDAGFLIEDLHDSISRDIRANRGY